MFDKIKNSKNKSLIIWVVVTTLFFLVFIFFLTPASVPKWIKSAYTIKRQNQIIENYKNDIESLDDRIENLTNDRDSLEKFAREKYYFSEPDEVVYVFDE